MKKIILFLFLASFIFAKSIGVISSLKGSVSIERGGNIFAAKLGGEVEKSDIVLTKSNGKAQLLFQDKTIITVGKNSRMSIDEYIFDGEKSKASFKVIQGAFKAMTGKIGKINPDKFKVKTETSTIGIRGTHFLGTVSAEQDAVACTQGKIEVASNSGGLPVDVRAGQITFVKPGELPTPPRDFSVSELKKLSSASGSEGNGNGKEGGNGTQQESETEETTTTDTGVNTEEIVEATEDVVSSYLSNTKTQFETCNYNATLKGFIVGTSNGVLSNDLVLNVAGGQKWSESYSDSYTYDGSTYGYSYSYNYCLNSISGSFTSDGDTYSVGTKTFYEDSDGYIGTSVASYYGVEYYSSTYGGETTSYEYTQAGASVDNPVSGGNEQLVSYDYDGLDHTMWGYWYSMTPAEEDDYYYADVVGYWVAGEETPVSTIDSFIAQNKVISYTGSLHGSDLNGYSFSMDFDFGSASSNPISGSFASYTVDSSSISGNSFSGTNSNPYNATSFEGKFYGPNASEIGGKYSTNYGSGIFVGKEATVN